MIGPPSNLSRGLLSLAVRARSGRHTFHIFLRVFLRSSLFFFFSIRLFYPRSSLVVGVALEAARFSFENLPSKTKQENTCWKPI